MNSSSDKIKTIEPLALGEEPLNVKHPSLGPRVINPRRIAIGCYFRRSSYYQRVRGSIILTLSLFVLKYLMYVSDEFLKHLIPPGNTF